MGIDWEVTLTGVFVAGVIFMILSLFKIREKIIIVGTRVEFSAYHSGGKTGFTSVVIAACFLVALFFSPLVSVISVEVTSAALIIVGALMAMEVRRIEWTKLEIVIPAFLTIIMMPLTSSVVMGIGLGFVFYPICLIAKKCAKEVHPIMYVLCLLFLAYFAFIV